MFKQLVFSFFSLMVFTSFVSAGVGLYIEQDTLYLQKGERGCLTYGITNPFSQDSYVEVLLSGESSLFLESQSVDKINIPAQTFPENYLPVEFCFDADLEDECVGESMEYTGSVLARQIAPEGASGSVVSAAVSNKLNLVVICEGTNLANFKEQLNLTNSELDDLEKKLFSLEKNAERSAKFILFAILALLAILAFLIYLKYSKRMERKGEALRITKAKYKKK